MLLNFWPMNLYYQTYPDAINISDFTDAEIPIVIIPGLFGSTANWRAVAKRLAESHKVIVVDQRNHGRSPHADSQSYADMVLDLRAFCDNHNLNKIILCGHSMGGKVAMLFALEYPAMVSQLVILDIAPIAYAHSHAPHIRALLAIDLSSLKSRSDADRQLHDSMPDVATRMFLLQSLTGSPGRYQWKLNLPALLEYMPEITGFPEVGGSSEVDAVFVAGNLSEYLLDQQHAKIGSLFPNSQFISVPNAGHWLHAEQPKQVIDIINNFIQE
ncbi:MAG: esterase [Arenicella sp.]|jgi:esterase